ncbi:hypothetical protein ABFS83_07G055200 [Erythranthe nasuta]
MVVMGECMIGALPTPFSTKVTKVEKCTDIRTNRPQDTGKSTPRSIMKLDRLRMKSGSGVVNPFAYLAIGRALDPSKSTIYTASCRDSLLSNREEGRDSRGARKLASDAEALSHFSSYA